MYGINNIKFKGLTSNQVFMYLTSGNICCMNIKEINIFYNINRSHEAFIKNAFRGLQINHSMIEKTKKFAKAASMAIKDTYPVVPKDWKLIMITDAVKQIFEGSPSVNTIKEYKRSGYFRGPEGEYKIYDGEARAFKMIYQNIINFKKMGIIEQELFEGKEHVVFFPANIPTDALHKNDQLARAVKRVTNDPLFQAFLARVDEE